MPSLAELVHTVADQIDVAMPTRRLVAVGHSGAYRTLAAWPGVSRPVTVGIGYEACRASLPRELHDIPLDALVTDAGFFKRPRELETT